MFFYVVFAFLLRFWRVRCGPFLFLLYFLFLPTVRGRDGSGDSHSPGFGYEPLDTNPPYRILHQPGPRRTDPIIKWVGARPILLKVQVGSTYLTHGVYSFLQIGWALD